MKTFQAGALMVSRVWSLWCLCMSVCVGRLREQEEAPPRGPKPPALGDSGSATPDSAQPLQTPRRERMSLPSLALVLRLEKEFLVSAQVSFLFWGSYNLKNSNFYFSFKGKSWYSSTKNRALIIIYSRTINPIILELFFPSKVLFWIHLVIKSYKKINLKVFQDYWKSGR